MDLERGQAMSNPPPSSSRIAVAQPVSMSRAPVSMSHAPVSMSRAPAAQQVSIDLGSSDDDFDMEIERGGAVVSQTPSMSTRPSGHTSRASTSMPASRPGAGARSGLDVAYRRMDARPAVIDEPSFARKLAAWAIPLLLCAGTIALLAKLVHHRGGRNVMSLLPHAFDASSTIQSGAFALTALVLAIALGFTGLKLHPRSYGMAGSAVALVLTSLAMVTVTLVSTDEQPSPPDGALLIPYVVPLAVFLLGLGIAGRGPSLFLRGGGRRVIAAFAGLVGGAIVFVAIEISVLAARLP